MQCLDNPGCNALAYPKLAAGAFKSSAHALHSLGYRFNDQEGIEGTLAKLQCSSCSYAGPSDS